MIQSLRPTLHHKKLLAGALVALLITSGCSSDPAQTDTGAPVPTAIAAPAGVNAAGVDLVLEVVDGGEATGLVLTDSRGMVVYGTIGETVDNLICIDDCTQVWVPLTADRGTAIADRLDAAQFGLFERPDGVVQVTYAGIPLYLWTGDNSIGITGGAGVAGTWFALTQTGGFIQ